MDATKGIHQKVRDWYALEFPSDDLGADISDITFDGVVECLNRGSDVYEALGVADSIVRERVFDRTAELLQVDYNVIFKKWIHDNKDPALELPVNTGQQGMTMGGM